MGEPSEDTVRDIALRWKKERDEAVGLLKRLKEYHKTTKSDPGVDWKLLIEVRDFVKKLEE